LIVVAKRVARGAAHAWHRLGLTCAVRYDISCIGLCGGGTVWA
jgi:hypothetical protein